MTLLEKRDALLAEFAHLTDHQQRLNRLIELARARPPLDVAWRTDDRLMTGCLSRLWFISRFQDGCCHFQSDSDSLIVKAIAGLLCDFYSGQTPEEILTVEPTFLAQIGLTQHITPNRRHTLARIRENIRAFAQTHAPLGEGGDREGQSSPAEK